MNLQIGQNQNAQNAKAPHEVARAFPHATVATNCTFAGKASETPVHGGTGGTAHGAASVPTRPVPVAVTVR